MSAPTAAVIKETKAQRSERLKLAKNPWNAWDEVRQFAKDGRGSVLPEWTGLYFKWWGVYTQGDGVGATGGVGGEGKATEFFMMRIGLPNGILTGAQLRVIGEITKRYARNLADISCWMLRRWQLRLRMGLRRIQSFITCRESSKSPSPAAPCGARTQRSTMLR
jgi:sulfite reductase (ferredoxin)